MFQAFQFNWRALTPIQAYEGEPNWEKAHRILVPAFGPVLIRNMFDEMHEICAQMCLKFARHGPTNKINTSEEFTRLALDTLALCSMNYRFNSFYRDDLHPFVKAMGDFLTECGNRTMRPKFMHKLLPATRKWSANIGILTKTANEVVEERRRNPGTRKDLLTAMLDGVDPKTGEKLTTENITHQLITFLVAGHETTSGTLSFAFCLLLQHPDTYNKVQEEVDRVIGRNPMTVDHLTKLPYISAVSSSIYPTLKSGSMLTVDGRFFEKHYDYPAPFPGSWCNLAKTQS